MLQAVALSVPSRAIIIKHGSNKEEERDNTDANTEVAISDVDILIAHHGLLIHMKVVTTTKWLPVLLHNDNYNLGNKAPEDPSKQEKLVAYN